MKIRPLQDRLLVKRLEEENTTSGGIIIPDTAKEKPLRGTIVAAGPGKRNEDGSLTPIDVKVGDVVMFAPYGGSEVKIEGETLIMMRADDVWGVIED